MTTQRQKEIDGWKEEQLTELVNELFEKFTDISEAEQIKMWPEYLYIRFKLQTKAPQPTSQS